MLTPRSRSLKRASAGMSVPWTSQVTPSPMSKTTSTSVPATSSKMSAGTSVSPFMSMVMVSPSSAPVISSRMSSQPALSSVDGPEGSSGSLGVLGRDGVDGCSGSTGAVTVTSQLAEKSPAVAVMVAVPAPTALTVPSLSTFATASLSEAQLTVLSVAFFGNTVAVSVALPPTVSDRLSRSSVTPVTATVAEETVTSHDAVF